MYPTALPNLIFSLMQNDSVLNAMLKIAEQIPGSKLVIIDGVDHVGSISKQEEIDMMVNDFLEEVNAEKSVNKTSLPMSH